MAHAFDPARWTPLGPGQDPRGTRFQAPFGIVEGRWWPGRIQLFHVLPRLAAPASLDLLPAVLDYCDSFGSIPRLGPVPAGGDLTARRAEDLALNAARWLGPAGGALQIACILALRALARAHRAAAGDADPETLVARFERAGLTFVLAAGGFPPGSARAGLRGFPQSDAERAREIAAARAATIRPDGILPALRKLRWIRPATGTLDAFDRLPLALPTFATAHGRLAAFQGAEDRLAEAGADLDRLARENGLPPLVLETP